MSSFTSRLKDICLSIIVWSLSLLALVVVLFLLSGFLPVKYTAWLYGQDALYAVLTNDMAKLKAVLKAGADPNDTSQKIAPIYAAAAQGNIEAVQILLDHHAYVDASGKGGHTGLYYAVQNGHKDVAVLLMENGAHLEQIRDNLELVRFSKLLLKSDIDNVIALATQSGHTALAQYLTKNKTDLAQKTLSHATFKKPQVTELMRYAYHEYDTRELAIFLAAHPYIDAKVTDPHGVTALMMATDINAADRVAMLVKHDPQSISLYDDNGWTALMRAAASGSNDAMRVLLQAKAELEQINSDGLTAFLLAVANGNAQGAELLLQAHANINAQDSDGWTALMWAVGNEDAAMRSMLLQAGADVSIKNNQGLTADDLYQKKKK